MKLILTFSLLALTIIGAAQTLNPQKDEATKLFGYKDSNNTWHIVPTYEEVQYFANGLAIVKKLDLFGVINSRNEIVIPFAYKFISSSNNEIFKAQDKNNKYGYFDQFGNKITEFEFDNANSFSSGLAAVCKKGIWGFINEKGKVVIPLQFDGATSNNDWDDFFGVLDFGYSFSGNYAVVKKEGLEGIIDKEGAVIIPFEYEFLEVDENKNVIAQLCEEDGGYCGYGLLDMSGKIILPFNYSHIVFSNGIYRIYQGTTMDEFFEFPEGGYLGLANINGVVIAPCIYDNNENSPIDAIFDGFNTGRYKQTSMKEGLINISKNGKWGFLNDQGKVAIPFQFETATSFNNDSAEVTLNGKKIIINKSVQCIKDCPDYLNLTTAISSSEITQLADSTLNKFMQFVLEDGPLLDDASFETEEVILYADLQANLDWVMLYGNAQQVALAKMIKVITVNSLAADAGKKSLWDAYEILLPIRSIIDGFSSSDFPIQFSFKGNNRHYEYNKALIPEKEYYYGLMSECEYKLSLSQAATDIRRTIEMKTKSSEKSFFIGFLLDYKKQQKQYDTEMLNLSNQLLSIYEGLSTEDRAWLNKENVWNANQPAAIEAAYTSNNKEKIGPSFYQTAYPIYRRLGDTENADYMQKKLYDTGYDDTGFLWEMATSAQTKSDKVLGAELAEKLSIKILANDCSDQQKLAEYYLWLGNSTQAKSFKQKADECENEKRKLQEKTDKEAKRNSRRYTSSYSANPGIYIGADVFPMLSTVKGHRDYGVCLDIVGRKMAHEFYYEIINKNRDIMSDLANGEIDTDGYDVRWDGYNAHYALKCYTNDDPTVSYVGFLARYRSKQFEPMVTDEFDANGIFLAEKVVFNPTEKQIELFLNYGVMTTKPGFACDMYFGFGPKYSIYSNNSSAYNSENTYSHPLIESRAEKRWGVGMRIGITVGFKIF
jgi:hypothetical protein